MRIHLQSLAGSPSNFPLDAEVWTAAAARAPDVSLGHEVSYGTTSEQFAAAAPEVEVLISQTNALAAVLPFHAPRLKMVFCTSAGLEKLSPFDWLPPGVPILNNRGTHAVKAGEYGIMALLMLASRIPALVTAQHEQAWRPLHGSVLAGRHVVVVGLGALGGSVAAQARHFGMRVTGIRATATPHEACDRVLPMEALDSVLPEAEFLFLAPPLTDATRGMLSRSRIALLPSHAGVVNIGRGGLVDQDALLDALDAGQIAGAVLDVFTPEPVPPGHRLWTTRNLLMTPHTSADDPLTYNARTLDIFFENLRAMQDGRALPNRFDPARGY
jgi:phosphoglycerate dehydrogenase-like enzyme